MILLDADKCTGCRTCELVCSVKNEGMVNPSLSRIQVNRFETVVFEIPIYCQQCAEPPCIAICPERAIFKNEETGIVHIDYKKCIGCKLCITACPFGAIGYDRFCNKVFKCEQCDGDPTCVKFCETEALQYVDRTPENMQKVIESTNRLSELQKV